MHSTYYVAVSSLVLPHGTFLKGEAVTLLDDQQTADLVDSGLLTATPSFKERSSVPERVVDAPAVQHEEDTPETNPIPAIDEVHDIAVQSEIEEALTVVEEPLEELPQRKKRNGRRKRSTERPS